MFPGIEEDYIIKSSFGEFALRNGCSFKGKFILSDTVI